MGSMIMGSYLLCIVVIIYSYRKDCIYMSNEDSNNKSQSEKKI